MKTILINARFLTRNITGVENYGRELTCELIKLKQFRYILAVPAGRLIEPLPDARIIQSKFFLKGHLWEQIILPYLCKKYRADLLFNPCNTGPVLVKKQVVTIHDAAVFAHPENFSKRFTLVYRYLLPLLGKVCQRVITDSDFSRKELIKYGIADQNKIIAVYNGVSFKNDAINDSSDVLTSHELKKNQYVLFVGSLDPRKNLLGLINAWAIIQAQNILPGVKLCVIGSVNKSFSMINFDKDRIKNVVFTNRVSSRQLSSLYRGAGVFVYPSFYEGFGHPPLEAMALGCPVVVSSTASLPEVCLDAAYYIDPYCIDTIVDGIRRLFTEDNLRKSLMQKGFERVKAFSWEKCAQETLNVFNDVLNS